MCINTRFAFMQILYLCTENSLKFHIYNEEISDRSLFLRKCAEPPRFSKQLKVKRIHAPSLLYTLAPI